MKTILCLGSLIASLAVGRAQYGGCGDCSVAALAYTTPVVYQMPVVYQAPVVYYAPVYYVATVAAVAGLAGIGYGGGYDRCCVAPSTVVHITGRGTYSYSTCGSYPYESTVIHIGSGPITTRSRYTHFRY